MEYQDLLILLSSCTISYRFIKKNNDLDEDLAAKEKKTLRKKILDIDLEPHIKEKICPGDIYIDVLKQDMQNFYFDFASYKEDYILDLNISSSNGIIVVENIEIYNYLKITIMYMSKKYVIILMSCQYLHIKPNYYLHENDSSIFLECENMNLFNSLSLKHYFAEIMVKNYFQLFGGYIRDCISNREPRDIDCNIYTSPHFLNNNMIEQSVLNDKLNNIFQSYKNLNMFDIKILNKSKDKRIIEINRHSQIINIDINLICANHVNPLNLDFDVNSLYCYYDQERIYIKTFMAGGSVNQIIKNIFAKKAHIVFSPVNKTYEKCIIFLSRFIKMLEKGYTIYYGNREIDFIEYAKDLFNIDIIKENGEYIMKCCDLNIYYHFNTAYTTLNGYCYCQNCQDKMKKIFSY
ncbi:hypothetical protein Hokovirus_4_15 [Hokovirus HKV1]|uniref:Uncharacterized protein n=1 Tax=Hokovirus HKV1 TaxID=1977638 RepID=A0A1V0SH99_9VIRU|nr:hypothetical protein Hokovirus_4_15 [Hokovirus HKV1]